METRRIRLREVRKEDFPILFIWRNSEKFRFLFHANENIIDFNAFCQEFTHDTKGRKYQYVIEKTTGQELIGFTYIHSYSEIDNYCFLNIFIYETFERKGYGVDVFVLFCLFLFKDIGINKIYVEAFMYNKLSLSCIRKSGMTELGTTPKKRMHKGIEHDVLQFVGDKRIIPTLTKIKDALLLPKPQ